MTQLRVKNVVFRNTLQVKKNYPFLGLIEDKFLKSDEKRNIRFCPFIKTFLTFDENRLEKACRYVGGSRRLSNLSSILRKTLACSKVSHKLFY